MASADQKQSSSRRVYKTCVVLRTRRSRSPAETIGFPPLQIVLQNRLQVSVPCFGQGTSQFVAAELIREHPLRVGKLNPGNPYALGI